MSRGFWTEGINTRRCITVGFREAHWDGKNDIGESVASGVYFYTLKAGDFSATRKMLIRK